jgi:secondary thiamine-phosphate synthase enzyme
MWHTYEIRLAARARGFHLVTEEIVRGLRDLAALRVGVAHLLLQHTSASLGLGENADPDVRRDLAAWVDRASPDGTSWFVHDAEGPDDMPAHVKSAILGTALSLPVRAGRLALGAWQGIYLGEHRDQGGARTVVATLAGE